MSDKLERLKRLKEARKIASTENDKAIAEERRSKRLQEVRNLAPVKAENEPKRLDEKDEKSKLLHYSIEETDKWHEKQQSKRLKRGQGFENLSQVAAMTYQKELSSLEVDKESYNRHKQNGLLSQGKEPNAKEISTVIDIHHSPDENAREALLKSLKESDERKLKKREKNQGSTEAYVNQKNRDFNRKLDRQYASQK